MLQASEIAPMCSGGAVAFRDRVKAGERSNFTSLILCSGRSVTESTYLSQYAQTACRVNGAMLPVAFAEFLGAACGPIHHYLLRNYFRQSFLFTPRAMKAIEIMFSSDLAVRTF